MVAHTTPYRTFSSLPDGFGRVNLYWRRYSKPTISIRLATRRCRPRPLHAYKFGPRPLSGQCLILAESDNPVFHLHMKIPMTNIRKTLFQLFHIYVGGVTLFNHLKYSEVVWIWTLVSKFLVAVFDALPGTPEVLLDLRLPQLSREQKHNYFSRLMKITTSSAFKNYKGRMSFSRLFRYWPLDSGYSVRLYQTLQM